MSHQTITIITFKWEVRGYSVLLILQKSFMEFTGDRTQVSIGFFMKMYEKFGATEIIRLDVSCNFNLPLKMYKSILHIKM